MASMPRDTAIVLRTSSERAIERRLWHAVATASRSRRRCRSSCPAADLGNLRAPRPGCVSHGQNDEALQSSSPRRTGLSSHVIRPDERNDNDQPRKHAWPHHHLFPVTAKQSELSYWSGNRITADATRGTGIGRPASRLPACDGRHSTDDQLLPDAADQPARGAAAGQTAERDPVARAAVWPV